MSDQEQKLVVSSPKTVPNGLKFVFGGLAGMGSTFFVQPLDLVKNRMQLAGLTGSREYTSSLDVVRKVIKKEGPLALYNGLSAGLARQAVYTSTRMGLYNWAFEKYKEAKGNPSFPVKALIGMSAGGIASFFGTPMEISLIRMTADGRLPINERRNYKSVFNALSRICRDEGVLTLWRGCTPTVVRSMVVNAVQLATYSQAKQQILQTKVIDDGILCHFCASMVTGLATSLASMPADIIKTRIQNMRIIGGRPEYSGLMDILLKVIKNEGFLSLWKGFVPYYMRIGPHTVLTFILLEQLNSFYLNYVSGQKI